MLKKTIALLIIFAMLVPFSSAVAADNTDVTPTIEEILNAYHEIAFAAQTAEDTAGATTWSRRSGSEKTLEQEAVEELTAAGYEAYHVTVDNYASILETLQTDPSELGIEQNGSYIIAVESDPNNTQCSSNQTMIGSVPEYDIGIGIEDGRRYVTYLGIRYYIRYVTVTCVENPNLSFVTEYALSDNHNIANYVLETLEIAAGVAVDAFTHAPISTVASLAESLYTNILAEQYTVINPNDYTLHASSAWTRQFIQVWNEDLSAWKSSQSSACAISGVWLSAYCFDPATGIYEHVRSATEYLQQYSPLYYDTDQRELDAVYAYLAGLHDMDLTGDINFSIRYNGVVITDTAGSDIIMTHPEKVCYSVG